MHPELEAFASPNCSGFRHGRETFHIAKTKSGRSASVTNSSSSRLPKASGSCQKQPNGKESHFPSTRWIRLSSRGVERRDQNVHHFVTVRVRLCQVLSNWKPGTKLSVRRIGSQFALPQACIRDVFSVGRGGILINRFL